MLQNLKTVLLLALLDCVFLLVGFLVAGELGIVIAAGVAIVVNGASYWFSDKLAVRAAHAHEVDATEAPELHRIVSELAAAASMPTPRIYVSDDPSPNAFATGRSPRHAAVCCTAGILSLCDERELRGVLGHELSHVRNRDILTASLAATLALGISLLAQFAQMMLWMGGLGGRSRNGDALLGLLVVGLLAAPAAMLIQLGISRSREYEADHDGAILCHDPLALRDALYKLELQTQRRPMKVAPGMAPLFIVNPFGRRGGAMASLFSTHPPLQDRMLRLERMAQHGMLPGPGGAAASRLVQPASL